VVDDLDINIEKSMNDIHFGKFSGMISDKTIKLLEKINNHPKIQDYMTIVSTDIKSIMVLYTEYKMKRLYRKNNKTNYMMALKNSLEICTSENVENSGSVLVYDVDAVFTNGNIRERCTIFQNIFFKDKEYRVTGFLLAAYREKQIVPECIDYYGLALLAEQFEEHNSHSCKTNIRNLVCDNQKYRKRRTRFFRENTEGFELAIDNIVPKLSVRESKFLQSRSNMDTFLPWKTGRMSWVVNENSMFAIDSHVRNKEIISGPSGHTHALLSFMKLMTHFDLKKWVLICIVWLVGCEHHSVHEVLIVAQKHHGLMYDVEDDTYEFVEILLSEI